MMLMNVMFPFKIPCSCGWRTREEGATDKRFGNYNNHINKTIKRDMIIIITRVERSKKKKKK